MVSASVALVGRNGEIRSIERAVEDVAAGRGRTLVVEGEPGIGKSALLAEAVLLAEKRGFAVYRASGESLGSDRPFGPIADALAVEPQTVDGERAAIATLLADRPLPQDPAFAAHLPQLRYQITEAFGDLVERLTSESPVLVALDDLQWSDTSTTQALVGLVDRFRDDSLLLIVAARVHPRPDHLGRALAALMDRGAESLALEALDSEAVGALAERVLGSGADAELRAALSRSGGNPLFVLELLAGWSTVRGGESASVAPDLRTQIGYRLQDISRRTVQFCQVGAVLGSTFRFDDAIDLAGVSMGDALALLDEAFRAGLLEERQGTVVFRHDVVREALYESASAPARSALHRRAAAMLEERGASAQVIARHARLGAVVGDVDAVQRLHAAAREIGPRAPREALELVRHAIELVGDHDELRRQLEVEQVQLLGWSGEIEASETQARRLLGEVDDPSQRLALHRHVGISQFLQNSPARAAEQSDVSAGEQDEPIARMRAVAEASLAYIAAGELSAARERAAQVLAEPSSDPSSRCIAHAVQSRLAMLVDADLGLGLAEADQAVAIAHDDPTGEAARYVPEVFRMLSLLDLDRIDDVVAELPTLRRRSVELDLSWVVPLDHALAALCHLFVGNVSDSRTEAIAGLAAMDEVGSSLAGAWLHGVTSITSALTGDLVQAQASVGAATTMLGTEPPLLGTEMVAVAEAFVLESAGDVEAAVDSLATTKQMFDALGAPNMFRECRLALVRLAHAAKRHDLLATAADDLASDAEATGVMSDVGLARFARGLADGDTTELHRAIAAYEQSPRVLSLAAVCETTAQVLWAEREKQDASRLLERARRLYDECGASASAARVLELFPALGLRRPRVRAQPSTGWESLTPGELRVVAGVRQGETNRQIAERLGLSRRTVGTHLTHVYNKLDIRSRVELAVTAERAN